jgi:PAS domain S-box-containing protein
MQSDPIKILLIEDNPGDARLVKEALVEARSAQFDLQWVEDLAQGIQAQEQDPAEVILLDLSLPDSSGIDTFKKVHACFPHTALILLTGLADEELAERMVHEGAEDFIVKGQMIGGLLARSIRYAIERASARNELAASERQYRELFENAVLGIFKVMLPGEPVAVNPEFAIMFGYASPAEFLTLVKEFAQVFADPQRWTEILQLKQVHPELTTFENLFRRKDGSTFWGNMTIQSSIKQEYQSSCMEGFIEDISERKRMETAIYLMSDSQRQIAHLDNARDIFRLVGEKVHDLIGSGYVGVSFYDDQIQSMKLLAINGAGDLVENLSMNYSVDLSKLVFPIKDMTEDELRLFRSGQLEKFENGLYRLLVRKVSRKICKILEEEMRLTDIYTMGFTWQNMDFGLLAIFANSDITPFKEMIEMIMNQACIALKRIHSEEALQKTKDYWQSLVENTSDLVTVLDIHGTILYQNPASKQILGYAPEELIGNDISKYINSEAASQIWDFLPVAAVNPDVRPPVAELSILCKDGSWRSMEITGEVRSDESGQGVAVLTSRDITERKKSEEIIKESEELFRSFIEQSSEGVILLDEQGTILAWNHAQSLITGLLPQQAIGVPFWDIQYQLLLPDRRAGKNSGFFKSAMLDAFRTGKFPTSENVTEATIFTALGETKSILQASFPIKTKNGFRIGSLVQDITDRKRAQEAVKLSEARYRNLVETQSDVIARSDLSGKLTFVNDSYCQTFGISREEMLGKVFYPTIVPEDLPVALAALKAIEKPPFRKQTETRHPTGAGIRWFSWENSAVLDQAGKPIELQGVGRDITERKRAEQALKESEERFRHISNSISDIAYSCTVLEDGNYSITWMTGAVDRVTGYSLEEILKQGCWKFLVNKEDLALFEKHVVGLPAGVSASCELRLQHKNGNVVWVESFAECIQETSLAKKTLYGGLVDITKRKNAEETLRALLLRHEALLAAIPEIVMEVDNGKVYRWANQAGLEFFGKDVIGQEARDYFIGDETVYQNTQPIFDGSDTTIYLESWQRRKDGEKRLLAWWCQSLKDEAGNVTGALSTARDVTEQKLVEEQTGQQMAELQRWYDLTLDRENRSLELKQEVNELLHRLNEPTRYLTTD